GQMAALPRVAARGRRAREPALGQTAGQLPVFCLAVPLVMAEPGLVHGRLRGAHRHVVIDCRAGPGPASGGALPAGEWHDAEGKIMRVFVTGATGALGRHLVPGLVAAGHEVTATTRTPGRAGQLRGAGAEPVILDGLDREAVIAAVRAAAAEVIVHQMTALAGMRSLRHPDKAF